MASLQVDKAPNEKFCFECGSKINSKAEICPRCGVRQSPSSLIGTSAPSGRNRIAAALFALLLGGIGIHKFYLGRVGQGILYILFCWTFIPALIAIIEGIIYLTMSDEAFNAKYG
jgi:TM2 domain-containing membrane protein YozV/ribosomal protein L40E